jgi:hypothetical protein
MISHHHPRHHHDVANFIRISFLLPSIWYQSSTMSDSIHAIEEMQKLDDIEADLADTAMAVAINEEASVISGAEAVEHVLEQAIPDAPEQVNGSVEDAQIDIAPAHPVISEVKEPTPSLPVQIPSGAGLPPRPLSNEPITDPMIHLPEGLTSTSPSVVSNSAALTGKIGTGLSDCRTKRQYNPCTVQLVGPKVGDCGRQGVV